jgi:hypothetical protein
MTEKAKHVLETKFKCKYGNEYEVVEFYIYDQFGMSIYTIISDKDLKTKRQHELHK